MLEFVRSTIRENELKYFLDYVSAGWPRIAPVEQFFLDGPKPGSRTAQRRLGRNLKAYARWGFVGTERPTVDPVTKRSVGGYDSRARRQIIRALASRRTDFSLADYLAAVDHTVSRQQALADLRASLDVELRGRGRGARWHRTSG